MRHRGRRAGPVVDWSALRREQKRTRRSDQRSWKEVVLDLKRRKLRSDPSSRSPTATIGWMPALARPIRTRTGLQANAEARRHHRPRRFAKAHAGSAAVFVDEINAGGLQDITNCEGIGSCKRNTLLRNLNAADRIHAQSFFPSEILGVMSASSRPSRLWLAPPGASCSRARAAPPSP